MRQKSQIEKETTFVQQATKRTLKDKNRQLYDKLLGDRQTRHSYMSEDGRYIYHLGIIDYLQDFNFDKWGENKLKSIIADGKMISAVPPKPYCRRFFDFMQAQVVINQDAIDVTRKEVNF
jgi:hypothetical protein